jgi:hypothetical protein
MENKYFELETMDDTIMSVQLSEVKEGNGINMVRVEDGITFMIKDTVTYGEETELFALISKEEARKLALILMNMAE